MNQIEESGFNFSLAGSCPVHSRLPLLIGPRCELPRSDNKPTRSTKVTARLCPPHELKATLPPVTGRRRESEPDYFGDDGRCIKNTRYVPVGPDEPVPLRYLQRIPAELLPRCVFFTEKEIQDGDE